MKVFFQLPKSADHQAFYARYAPLIPSLVTTGYCAQLVSAVTEFGILYAIALDKMAPVFSDAVYVVATAVAVVGTVFIEVGLRKLLPYATRAVIRKRWTGWDRLLSRFILATATGLVITSAVLSFVGSQDLVSSVTPPPSLLTTTTADSTYQARVDGLKDHYSELTTAVELNTAADLAELEQALAKYQALERKTGSRYTTRKATIREQITKAESEQARKLSTLRTQRTIQLQQAAADHRSKLQQIENRNEVALATVDSQVTAYGYGLAAFTVVCLLVFILSVIISELHKAGSDIEHVVEPGAYDFEAGPLEAFTAALLEWMKRHLYGLTHRLESNTADPLEPVQPPTLWVRSGPGLRQLTTDGAPRKTAQTPPRRLAGFNRQMEDSKPEQPSANEDRVTIVVKEVDKHSKPCGHCGTPFLPKNHRHTYCQDSCRMEAHAARHGGTLFDPRKRHRPKK
jgi:hypothetical protein